MFKKFINLRKIFGNKNYFFLLSVLVISVLSSFLELIGISLIGVFAISISDPGIVIEKIPVPELKFFLNELDRVKLIILFSISIIIVFLLKHSLSFFISFLEIKISKKILLDIKKKIFTSFLSQNYEYFLNNNKSYLTNLVSGHSQSFMGYIFQVFSILKELILISLIFFGIIYVNWKIILFITLILTLLTYTFVKFFKKKLNDIGNKSRILEKTETQYLNEAYQSIKFIKLGSKENFFINLISKVAEEKNKYQVYHYLIGKLPKIFLEMIIIIIFTSVVIFLIDSSQNNQTIFGTITFLAFASIRLLPSFVAINNAYTSLSFFRSPFEIIYSMMMDLIDFEKNNLKILLNENIKKITFKNVDFKYVSTDKHVLHNISFEVKENDFLGIIGASGSGKSTILHLLSGLLKPNKGSIILNDYDKNNINEYNLNNKISYVPQDSFILDSTLEKNIAFADQEHEINQKKISECLSFTNLGNFVENLPKKTKSLLGDDGSKISHGQRQRIGLARAIYNDPNVIILDESLNALDYDNEKEILSNIKQLNNKILIFVSHRLESLKLCNKLLIMSNGIIKDFGEKDLVLSRNQDLNKYLS
jgi:ATP-binding cassette, subfamily B, bacterial PglK